MREPRISLNQISMHAERRFRRLSLLSGADHVAWHGLGAAGRRIAGVVGLPPIVDMAGSSSAAYAARSLGTVVPVTHFQSGDR